MGVAGRRRGLRAAGEGRHAAGLFARAAIRDTPRFSLGAHTAPWGLLLVVVALVGYPVASHLLGHHHPETPTFGVPCPTTIFTLGMLLLCVSPVPRTLLAIPLLWAAVGAVAAFAFSMYEDFVLVFAGLLTLLLQVKDPEEGVEDGGASSADLTAEERRGYAEDTQRKPSRS